MREYPIEIEQIIDVDNGDLVGFYTKGHHEAEPFIAAIHAEYGREEEEEEFDPANVERSFIRAVPVKGGEYVKFMFIAAQPGRGAFPITQIQRPI